MKYEAQYQIIFKHWLQSGAWQNGAALFELKQTQGKSIPFDAVQPHQIRALVACEQKHAGLYFKIPDDSQGEKPVDCFYLVGIKGYVVLFFGSKHFYVIPIQSFLREERKSQRRSITESMALRMACMAIHR